MEDMRLPATFSPRRTDAAGSRVSLARLAMRTIISQNLEYSYALNYRRFGKSILRRLCRSSVATVLIPNGLLSRARASGSQEPNGSLNA